MFNNKIENLDIFQSFTLKVNRQIEKLLADGNTYSNFMRDASTYEKQLFILKPRLMHSGPFWHLATFIFSSLLTWIGILFDLLVFSASLKFYLYNHFNSSLMAKISVLTLLLSIALASLIAYESKQIWEQLSELTELAQAKQTHKPKKAPSDSVNL